MKKSTFFTDQRDGKTYKTVKNGGVIWMAENLNYEGEGSKCYNNDPANTQKYGRLYDWETALKACPEGWHLPSIEELSIFFYTDGYEFAALCGFGGFGYSGYGFRDINNAGYWWGNASEDDEHNANFWCICSYDDYVFLDSSSKSYLFSVRCVKD